MSDLEKLCNEYRENKRMIEELTAMNDALKSDILSAMGDSDTMIVGAAKISNKLVKSSRLDGKALQAAHPDIYTAYTVDTEYRRFIVS
jgi:predicted phage-related endonuclease